jgi:hypothetical protein
MNRFEVADQVKYHRDVSSSPVGLVHKVRETKHGQLVDVLWNKPGILGVQDIYVMTKRVKATLLRHVTELERIKPKVN